MREASKSTTQRLAAATLLLVLAVLAVPRADANWLSRLTREAGEVGSKAGKFGIASLDHAAAFVAKLPMTRKGVALAAHASPEGHWTFVNRSGEAYTAATSTEMARVMTALEPGAPAGSKLSLYISEDTAFKQRAALSELPAGSELYVVVERQAYGLRTRTTPAGSTLFAEIRPNIVVEVADRQGFEEAVFHLGRHLNRANIRVLALEPGGPKALSSVPGYDPATKAALVDAVDPSVLGSALGRLKGQTVLVTGRLEGDVLVFKPSTGSEGRISLASLAQSADAADVSIVVLQSPAARQPGGRNWLWQTVSVSGLEDALKRATFGDFLNALAAGRGELIVAARPSAGGRTTLVANPSGNSAVPMTDAVGSWFSETAGELMGDVVVQGVTAFVPDKTRASELDLRIIPGIPSSVQFAYLACLVAGLIGWEFSLRWWRRLWPPEVRGEYRGAAGYHAARAARIVAMVLVFLPIAGVPAMIAALLVQAWRFLTAPVRWFGWVRDRLKPARTVPAEPH